MASLPRTPRSKPPELKASAQREERSGRLRRAIALLEELLRETPDDWSSLQRLADLRARNGDRRIAVDLYRRLAEHYEQDDHLARAIAAWRLVLRHDPALLDTHLKLGELYARQGFRVESRIHYETALAGFQRAGRRQEAEQVRRALEAADGRIAVVPTTTPPGGDDSQPGTVVRPEHTSGEAPAGQSADGGAEPPFDEKEFVAERLVEAKMFRRYKLFAQAQSALESILQRAPDHVEAREELVEVLRDQGEKERAAEEQRRLRSDAAPVATPPAPEPTGGTAEHEPSADAELADIDIGFIEEEPPPPVDVDTPGVDPLDISEIFDDVLAAAERPREPEPPAPEGGSDGEPVSVPISDVLPVLREHVNAQISQEDYGARYDLGIAYREMGLVDEAIAEFQLAARDPDRLVDCASLMAGCFVEKGLPGLAVKWLERALASPGIGDEESQALRYELGDALERKGETTRALEVFTDLYGEAAGHRDVAERVRRFGAQGRRGEGT